MPKLPKLGSQVIRKLVPVAGIVQPLDVMAQATKMWNDGSKGTQQELVALSFMESVDHCDMTVILLWSLLYNLYYYNILYFI